ncbi:MAG: dehydrogenase [Bacteroidetes bacterium RIFOXYA12_FULL_35_11]|nr:MAG: dehydrogenase [Bacteroidetes bacterium GWF2_35_48]OFY72515.1 MAG: dehydrogenase [Bacteroidetes bacterium RIFOXYA12_FULL_35_11]OFY96897.1 MAG: dehydrogenase [Bacteroidetes bacterium RIFOXYB2_FULL_35_7]OFZ03145.1 MAG: dehydrogenase [Bacteroidetes bacterium RIFOXYC12_FULL_35_7]HBX50220.1 dehydrogenase [Bacteroidales bacterium]
MKQKIAVIGFGAAAIGFIEKSKDSGFEIHVFEKSKDIYSSSISGIRADGKLFVSREMGGDIEIDMDLQKKLVDYYINFTNDKNVETGHSFTNEVYYKKFYEKGFQPITSDFYHIGTDQLKEVLYNIYEHFKKIKNIHFHFEQEITEVEVLEKSIRLSNGEIFDKVIVGVGRSGHKLVTKIISKYPQLILDNSKVDLGIRYELPNHIVEELNKEMYEFKIRYKSKTGYMVRTFCNNPSGYVVTENYDDFTTVNGHAKMKEKSTNTNFAILATLKLTQPFNDPIGYGSYIAKLANLLAGDGKVLLQTYSHFKNSKRSKNWYRVFPTLDENKYILGDINLAFPRRIIESIIDFIENLDIVVPGVANPDNLVYAPEIKFYSNYLNNNTFSSLYFIGDCSGATRSIIYATAHGYLVAEMLGAK